MDAAFLKDRIAATKTQILAYEAAIDALVTGGVQEYRLDTGQSTQKVTRLNLDTLQKQLESLYNRCATMQARLNGSGSFTVRPDW